MSVLGLFTFCSQICIEIITPFVMINKDLIDFGVKRSMMQVMGHGCIDL